jgi:hypothetical protein
MSKGSLLTRAQQSLMRQAIPHPRVLEESRIAEQSVIPNAILLYWTKTKIIGLTSEASLTADIDAAVDPVLPLPKNLPLVVQYATISSV